MNVELLVIGAGPAGVSAALWAKALELDVLLLDGAPVPGGQLHAVHFHPQDVPGFEQGDGPALAAAYARQLAAASVPLRTACFAETLEAGEGRTPRVTLAGGEAVEARAVLVASGVRRRRLEVPGEREFENKGVSFSATRDREQLAGRTVAVVGGGDAAFENALLLEQAGSRVTIVVRGVPRARAEFRSRAAAAGITVLPDTRVLAVLGDDRARALRISGPGGERELAAEGFVIKAGVVPNSEWCRGSLACDAEGYVVVDERLATTAPAVWAAGDITRPQPPSIPVAIGQGAQAIAMIRAALRGR
ncbi:MAG: NAD(P)/FAD-dependent oxidoreductase [Candidatus Eisenbacteria bacterium]|uniref:NAD(P)/FAD-dependent oxidoreductase n=1 Tax=Eiseniibacteriota bacterium TaxID=2212470 RepID=A0A933W9U3_UNCEI|nr:NAD(P)/FAD-dependent oxidoreductase [Candidatus Eisenbacteria bacterium]